MGIASTTLNIRISPEDKEKLKELADKQNRSISNFILTTCLNLNKKNK